MLKPLARIALATVTVAAALSLAAPAAFAAGTWTATGGPNFTGTQSPGTTFTFADTTSGTSIVCTKASAAGTVTTESGGTNTAILHFSSLSFSSCNGPLGSTATIMSVAGTSSTFNAISYNSTTKIVTGTMTGLSLTMSLSSVLGTCTASVKGTAGATYNDNKSLLQFTTVGDSLSVTSASGACSGVIVKGDVLTLSSGTGGIVITGSPKNPIIIKQP